MKYAVLHLNFQEVPPNHTIKQALKRKRERGSTMCNKRTYLNAKQITGIEKKLYFPLN